MSYISEIHIGPRRTVVGATSRRSRGRARGARHEHGAVLDNEGCAALLWGFKVLGFADEPKAAISHQSCSGAAGASCLMKFAPGRSGSGRVTAPR